MRFIPLKIVEEAQIRRLAFYYWGRAYTSGPEQGPLDLYGLDMLTGLHKKFIARPQRGELRYVPQATFKTSLAYLCSHLSPLAHASVRAEISLAS